MHFLQFLAILPGHGHGWPVDPPTRVLEQWAGGAFPAPPCDCGGPEVVLRVGPIRTVNQMPCSSPRTKQDLHCRMLCEDSFIGWYGVWKCPSVITPPEVYLLQGSPKLSGFFFFAVNWARNVVSCVSLFFFLNSSRIRRFCDFFAYKKV